MQDFIVAYLQRTALTVEAVARELAQEIATFAQWVRETLDGGGKVVVFGNGGSAADAQHFAAELVVRYSANRPALAALALTTDTSLLTAAANDFGYEQVFARQIEALGKPGDLVVAISTSGQSANVLRAVEAARKLGLRTVGLTGRDGGKLALLVHLPIIVPATEVSHIQEGHEAILHLVAHLTEEWGIQSSPASQSLQDCDPGDAEV